MDDIARGIAADIAAGRLFRIIPELAGADAMDSAYAVQDALTPLRGGQAAVAGYKLAFNSAASRDYYGLAEGCIAPIYARDIRQDGAILRLADFHSLVIEPEICLELGADLDHHPGLSAAQAMAAVVAIRPAVEVMDPRGALAQDPSAAQAVAQGIHTAGAVLGAPVSPDLLPARHGITTRLMLAGAEVGAKTDAAPQDPAEALVWAARALSRRGLALRKGMILMCGTHLPVQAVAAPCAVRAEMGLFGAVEFSVV
jgi:2-keto-4-pentenoate hydratase